MKKFKVEVTETLSRTVEIYEESEVEALAHAREMYENEEIVLTADDYVDTEITSTEEDS